MGAIAACSVVNIPEDPLPAVTSGTTASGTAGQAGSDGGSGTTSSNTAGSGATATGGAGGGSGGQPPAVCGDGVPGGDEECDDGDTEAGDGCDAQCGAEGTCSEPLAISLSDSGQGTLVGSISAANLGGPDQVGEALCDGATAGSGWDRIYRIELSQTRDLLLELTADFDAVVRLQSAPCDASSALAEPGGDGCSNQGSLDVTETLWLPSLSAGTYYIVVDGGNPAAEGTFTLDVTASCPARSLRLTQLDIGANDGLHLVNTSATCAVDLGGVGVLFDDSAGGDRALTLPGQWLAPGATDTSARVASTSPPRAEALPCCASALARRRAGAGSSTSSHSVRGRLIPPYRRG
jgi:cysteine-rich repeat protein